MTLSARAIALQGLGAAPRFVALQGLVPVEIPVEPPIRLPGGITGGNVGGASMSLDEWLRRGHHSPEIESTRTIPGAEPRKKKRTKRERDEEFVVLLSKH